MPTRQVEVNRALPEVWAELQRLETWEGLGGMHDLRDGKWDDAGDLRSFAFSIETPLGNIRDRAKVTANQPLLGAIADTKGISVEVELTLAPAGQATQINFSIDGRSTSFLTRALVGALKATLENGIDEEAATLVRRLDPGAG